VHKCTGREGGAFLKSYVFLAVFPIFIEPNGTEFMYAVFMSQNNGLNTSEEFQLPAYMPFTVNIETKSQF
jgi:hypothetical protein